MIGDVFCGKKSVGLEKNGKLNQKYLMPRRSYESIDLVPLWVLGHSHGILESLYAFLRQEFDPIL
jgi:hypothetical protein